MVVTPTYVVDYERVIGAFGYWPTFHDARALSFRRSVNILPIVSFIVHAFEVTSELDEDRHFVLAKHHRVHFRFTDVADPDLDRFWVMNENTLARLAFSAERHDGRFGVELDSAVGAEYGGSFRARFGEVLSVTPCSPDGQLP